MCGADSWGARRVQRRSEPKVVAKLPLGDRLLTCTLVWQQSSLETLTALIFRRLGCDATPSNAVDGCVGLAARRLTLRLPIAFEGAGALRAVGDVLGLASRAFP